MTLYLMDKWSDTPLLVSEIRHSVGRPGVGNIKFSFACENPSLGYVIPEMEM